MKTVKPFAALLLLGAASLTACGKPDTVQESELQPAKPRQAEREQILAELQQQEPQAPGDPEAPICRNLKPGDAWYPRWTYCCDSADKTQSYWTGAEGYPSGTWSGSCYSFGIR